MIRMKYFSTLAACVIALSLGACSSDSAFPDATGEGNVRAINAITTAPPFSFLIEERLIANVGFGESSTTFSYDDLEYNFNFEVVLAGTTTRTRVATEFLDVERDKDYTFVIGGDIATPTITLWEADVREWAGDETVFEARFAHAAPATGAVDVYLAEATDPPTAPVAGADQGTLTLGETTAAADFAGGEYILTVTAAGDETAILYQSVPFTPSNASSIILTIFDSVANNPVPVTVSQVNASGGGSTRIPDSRSLPPLRFFHASIDGGDTDIYVEDPLDTPLVVNHAFRDVTGDFEVAAGDTPITYTTASNVGSILVERTQTVEQGSQYNIYFIESVAGEDAIIVSITDRRPVETIGKVSFINTATNHSIVDLYVVEADTGIDEALPFIGGLPLGAVAAGVQLSPDSYDAYVTAPLTKDVLAGPVRLDLAGGDVLDALIYDNVDPAIADLVFVTPP